MNLYNTTLYMFDHYITDNLHWIESANGRLANSYLF